jgi:hypothetical protein
VRLTRDAERQLLVVRQSALSVLKLAPLHNYNGALFQSGWPTLERRGRDAAHVTHYAPLRLANRKLTRLSDSDQNGILTFSSLLSPATAMYYCVGTLTQTCRASVRLFYTFLGKGVPRSPGVPAGIFPRLTAAVTGSFSDRERHNRQLAAHKKVLRGVTAIHILPSQTVA